MKDKKLKLEAIKLSDYIRLREHLVGQSSHNRQLIADNQQLRGAVRALQTALARRPGP